MLLWKEKPEYKRPSWWISAGCNFFSWAIHLLVIFLIIGSKKCKKLRTEETRKCWYFFLGDWFVSWQLPSCDTATLRTGTSTAQCGLLMQQKYKRARHTKAWTTSTEPCHEGKNDWENRIYISTNLRHPLISIPFCSTHYFAQTLKCHRNVSLLPVCTSSRPSAADILWIPFSVISD